MRRCRLLRGRSSSPRLTLALAGSLALLLLSLASRGAASDSDLWARYRTVRKSGAPSFAEGCQNYRSVAEVKEVAERNIALLIGVSDYAPPDQHLESPSADVPGLREYLIDVAGFDEVYTLMDANATFERIADFMEAYLPTLLTTGSPPPATRFLFYFSGHGDVRKIGGNEVLYLRLHHTPNAYGHSLNANVLAAWLRNARPAQQVLVVIDTCNAGGIFEPVQRLLGNTATRPRPERRDKLLWPGFQVAAATTLGEDARSGAKPGETSLFTGTLLTLLRGDAGPSVRLFTASDLIRAAKPLVMASSSSAQVPSIATVFPGTFEEADFFFWNAARCTKDDRTLVRVGRAPPVAGLAPDKKLSAFGRPLLVSLRLRQVPRSEAVPVEALADAQGFVLARTLRVEEFGDAILDLQGRSTSDGRLTCNLASRAPGPGDVEISFTSLAPRACGDAAVRVLTVGSTHLLRVLPAEGGTPK